VTSEALFAGNENVVELDALRNELSGAVDGRIGAGSTTTTLVTAFLSPPPALADALAGRTLVFTDNTPTALLRGRGSVISASTVDGHLTIGALLVAPIEGDLFQIVNYLNDATVTLTLKDTNGNVVAGVNALAMPYVSGSRGKYQVTLPDTLAITPGSKYTRTIIAERAGVTYKREKLIPCLTPPD
jgi:hypothetical protein